MRKICILSLAALGAITVAAYADIIASLSSITINGNGFSWNYSSNVTVDERVEPGDFFTVYDFGNFVPGSNMQPANWAFSSAFLGRTPPLVIPNDNPDVLNLTWTYIGQNPIIGPAPLGIFSVVTNTDQQHLGQFASEATRNGGPNDGTKIDNIGGIAVPVPEMSALVPILSVCSATLLALLPSFLRRRQIA
jgi:hypothetical protein